MMMLMNHNSTNTTREVTRTSTTIIKNSRNNNNDKNEQIALHLISEPEATQSCCQTQQQQQQTPPRREQQQHVQRRRIRTTNFHILHTKLGTITTRRNLTTEWGITMLSHFLYQFLRFTLSSTFLIFTMLLMMISIIPNKQVTASFWSHNSRHHADESTTTTATINHVPAAACGYQCRNSGICMKGKNQIIPYQQQELNVQKPNIVVPTYYCSCPPLYTGVHCEIKYKACPNSPISSSSLDNTSNADIGSNQNELQPNDDTTITTTQLNADTDRKEEGSDGGVVSGSSICLNGEMCQTSVTDFGDVYHYCNECDWIESDLSTPYSRRFCQHISTVFCSTPTSTTTTTQQTTQQNSDATNFDYKQSFGVMKSSFCTNGGRCKIDMMNSNKQQPLRGTTHHAGCICPDGFSGKHCEVSTTTASTILTKTTGATTTTTKIVPKRKNPNFIYQHFFQKHNHNNNNEETTTIMKQQQQHTTTKKKKSTLSYVLSFMITFLLIFTSLAACFYLYLVYVQKYCTTRMTGLLYHNDKSDGNIHPNHHASTNNPKLLALFRHNQEKRRKRQQRRSRSTNSSSRIPSAIERAKIPPPPPPLSRSYSLSSNISSSGSVSSAASNNGYSSSLSDRGGGGGGRIVRQQVVGGNHDTSFRSFTTKSSTKLLGTTNANTMIPKNSQQQQQKSTSMFHETKRKLLKQAQKKKTTNVSSEIELT